MAKGSKRASSSKKSRSGLPEPLETAASVPLAAADANAHTQYQNPDQVVKSLLEAIPQAIAADVVDLATGQTCVSSDISANFHLPMLATCNTEVVHQMLDIITALRLTDQHLDEILVTTSTQYHLIKLYDEGKRFIYCAVRKRDTSLALAREVVRLHASM